MPACSGLVALAADATNVPSSDTARAKTSNECPYNFLISGHRVCYKSVSSGGGVDRECGNFHYSENSNKY